MVQCLRVDLCTNALREIERMAKYDDPATLVDQLLERHYANEPMLDADDTASGDACQDDGRLAWRREQILYLLEEHPSPYDKLATAGLVGRQIADQIRDLKSYRSLGIPGRCAQIVRSYRRIRFQSRCRLWPGQLRPGFPYEYLGPTEAARLRLNQLKTQLPAARWAEMQLPTETELVVARQRLHATPNALGLLLADAFLSTDIKRQERTRRYHLQTLQNTLADTSRHASGEKV
jgi:hypothetical protein